MNTLAFQQEANVTPIHLFVKLVHMPSERGCQWTRRSAQQHPLKPCTINAKPCWVKFHVFGVRIGQRGPNTPEMTASHAVEHALKKMTRAVHDHKVPPLGKCS